MSHIEAVPIDIRWHPGMSIFASEPFLRAVGEEYGWLGGKDEGGRLRCILPFTIIRKGLVRMVRFRVQTIPVADDFSVEEEKAFLNRCMVFFKNSRADVVIPATTNSIFRTYPDGAKACPYGTYVIDLTQPEETLWRNVSESHRRKIHQAERSGVVIRWGGEHAEAAYRLVRDTFGRSSLPFMTISSFTRMLHGLGENVMIGVADYQGTLQGAIVVPFSAYAAYYVYGGSRSEPTTGANHLLHWHAIRQFRQLGVQRYDFVGVRIDPRPGTKQEGLATFKQRFGGQLVPGFMWKCSIRAFANFLYSAAVRLSRRGDIVDRETHRSEAMT